MGRVYRDDKFIKAFGEKVREIRLSKNMSQYQLSYLSDISRDQIRRIESGKINTSISMISALAKALNVHPKDLVSFDFSRDRDTL